MTILGTIFSFSNQNGEKSGALSQNIAKRITKNIKTMKNSEEEQIVLRKIEKTIRKLAHFSLYTIVGILLMSLMSTYNIRINKKSAISFYIGFFYAVTDEIHQIFIPGRTSSIKDIGIDCLGVLFGILIITIICKAFIGNYHIKLH